MTTPKRLTRTYLALTAGLLVLLGMNLLWGSVSLTPQAVLAALLGTGQAAQRTRTQTLYRRPQLSGNH